jgi:hypothetical protein
MKLGMTSPSRIFLAIHSASILSVERRLRSQPEEDRAGSLIESELG